MGRACESIEGRPLLQVVVAALFVAHASHHAHYYKKQTAVQLGLQCGRPMQRDSAPHLVVGSTKKGLRPSSPARTCSAGTAASGTAARVTCGGHSAGLVPCTTQACRLVSARGRGRCCGQRAGALKKHQGPHTAPNCRNGCSVTSQQLGRRCAHAVGPVPRSTVLRMCVHLEQLQSVSVRPWHSPGPVLG